MALIWLIIAVVLIAAEILSGDFVLVMLGVSALAAAGVQLLLGTVFATIAFAVVALGLISFARPWLRRRFQIGTTADNVQALIGGHATVVSTVDGEKGQVKIRGQVWSARSFDEQQVITPGTRVTVMQISGATALVLADHDHDHRIGPAQEGH